MIGAEISASARQYDISLESVELDMLYVHLDI